MGGQDSLTLISQLLLISQGTQTKIIPKIVNFFFRDTGVVELGAGSGFLSQQLRDRGCDIESFDNKDDMTYQKTWKKLPCSNLVKHGGLEEVAKLNSR